MSVEIPQYPNKIFDGITKNRTSREDDINPNFNDFDCLVAEVIQMQSHVGIGPVLVVVDKPTIVFDIAKNKKQEVVLGGNRTLDIKRDSPGNIFMVRLIQDGTGSRTVTWWSGIAWPGGTDPVLTISADAIDSFVIFVRDTGIYDGYILRQAG